MDLGVDSGGTFTDLVSSDGTIAKVLSTPDDPGRAVRAGIGVLTEEPVALLAHGTTVATNALLERRGAVVALVTTAGFEDVIEIARQDRPSLYDQWADRPAPLVPRELRLAPGDAVDRGVECVAVCLLHADLDPSDEAAISAALRGDGFDVTASHEVSPEFREYERTVTTVINAYLRPACRSYLHGLADAADEVLVMTSAGGLVPVAEAADVPVSLLLSGPAGGVRAAAAVAAANGFPDCVTFDMGGTSTDVCLVRGGVPEPAPGREVGGFSVRLPSLDIHTIGAGGGSIASIDAGGALVVGPESAGAEPGPACYGRGGTRPTVTDANLVLGRIPPGAAFGGLALDRSAAAAALERAGVSAHGVVTVVNANMERALRAVSVERGVDPRELALVAFGGAGPLHACELADALGMPAVIVPPRAGVLSAVGLLCSPRQHVLVRSFAGDRPVEAAVATLADEARASMEGDVTVTTAVDCRYAGQSHELTVPTVADFHAEHERRNGYARPDAVVEVVAIRATARRPPPLEVTDLPPVERAGAVGPTVIAEPDCTIWLPEGWTAEPGAGGALVATRPVPPAPRSDARSADLDAAGLQVSISRLTGVAEEMGAVLRRAAFSPNIKERADCSAALFTAAGELLVQAEHIPVHLGSMPASVRAAIDAVGDRITADQQVILNDPFAGGTHLNDVTLVAPVFLGDELVGWAANRAHHADLGGAAPGSIPADATEIQQEGLRIPPVLLTDEVRQIMLAASRTPEERAGDLDAQIGANVLGVQRLAEIAASGAPLDEIVAYGERRMRATLAEMPDGSWTFEDILDSSGPRPEQQHPTTIRLRLTIDGDAATFDFTGTDPQQRGNVNAVEAVTVSSVAFALRSVADPTIPANGGALRPVRVIAPAGTVVAAQSPVAVGAGNVEVSQRVADVCLGVLATALPGRVAAAGQGTMNNVLIGGAGNGGWVYYETVAGGQGARPGGDGRGGAHTATIDHGDQGHQSAPCRPGQSGIHTGMTNTKNTPVEALERHYPMRVLRYRLRRGSGGAGACQGGEGIERDLLMLEDVTVSLITERRVSRPWGLAGGGPGAPGENWLLPGGDEARAQRLSDKCTIPMKAGDVLRMLTPGGGGWGTRPGREGT